jgi:quinol monooxygenase YgiN
MSNPYISFYFNEHVNLYKGGRKKKMAITINIYYTGKNGSARKFAEEMTSTGVVSAIRAEDGNIRYDYFYPMNDPETVLLIDSWENQEAIDVHHASPMMEQITKLREKYDLSMKVERYVSDEAGIPSADQKYIRD